MACSQRFGPLAEDGEIAPVAEQTVPLPASQLLRYAQLLEYLDTGGYRREREVRTIDQPLKRADGAFLQRQMDP